MDFRAPPILSITDFLLYLFQERKLQPSTIDFYILGNLPPIKSMAGFLLYLVQDRKLQASTIDGYRSTIAYRLGNSPINISKDKNFTHLLDSFHRDRLTGHRGIPWYFTSSQRLPLNPLKRNLTCKMVFLFVLAMRE